MTVLRRVLLLIWMLSPQVLVNSHPTVQCAHTGSGFTASWNRQGWKEVNGPFTIGAKNFGSIYGGAMVAGFLDSRIGEGDGFKDRYGYEKPHCPYNYIKPNAAGSVVGEIELCDEKDERVILRVNAVQQTDSPGNKHTLAGWLHLEVELRNKSDQIRMIHAQMYDEWYNAVGEFVMDPNEQCGASKNPDKYITPTPYQYLPCSAIGAREAKPSQAVYMVHKGDAKNETIKASPVHFPSKDLTSVHGVHFTWRMNEYWCSRHYRITPMVFVLTTNEIEKWKITTRDGTLTSKHGLTDKMGLWKMLRKAPRHWLHPIWFGAAGIKHPGRGPFECSNPVINDQLNSPTDDDATWILEKIPFHVTFEYLHDNFLRYVTPKYAGAQTCQLNPYPLYRLSPAFGGRCIDLKTDRTSRNYLQTCNKDASSKEFKGLNISFETYGNYVAALQSNRSEISGNPCRAPIHMSDAKDISLIKVVVSKRVDLSHTGITHTTRTKDSISKFWRGRKFHGVLCILVSMFLMPVSLFSARYYKETFMKFQCKGGHLWYWIHIGTCLISMAVLFTSQTALSNSIGSWGRSQDTFGIIHDSLGWISHVGFIGLIIMGGLRSTKVQIRKILMTAHSAIGFLQYVINPSPSLDECGDNGLPTGFSPIVAIVFAWVAVDVIFHLLLTGLIYQMDISLQIRRGWYCPIIPILEPTSHEDMRGAPLRRILILVYILLSGGFTLGAVLQMTLKEQPDGCIFGETACKSPLGCTRAAIAMCKKLQYAACE